MDSRRRSTMYATSLCNSGVTPSSSSLSFLLVSFSVLLLLICPINSASAQTLNITLTQTNGVYTLFDNRVPNTWSWSGVPVPLLAQMVADSQWYYDESAATVMPSTPATTTMSTLPGQIQTFAAQQGYDINLGDTVSVVSQQAGTASVWAIKYRINRPFVNFVSTAFSCSDVALSSTAGSFLCTSFPGQPFSWTATITNSILNEDPFLAASTSATVSINTVPPSAVDSITGASQLVNQLISLAFVKVSASAGLQSDSMTIRDQTTHRRDTARVAVGFMWIFILLTSGAAVFVCVVWMPWAIGCMGNRLHNFRTIAILYTIFAVLFVILGLTEGLAGFVILLLLLFTITAGINFAYCCSRARRRGDEGNLLGDTIAGGSLEESMDQVSGDKYKENDENAALVKQDTIVGDATNARPLVQPYTHYPNSLGSSQRSMIGWGSMSFLVGAVVCCAIFGLWAVDDYLIWDRYSSQPTTEFMPQAISKATFLVYAFDGFADRIRMNNIFFDVSTQWCGAHYSTQLNTPAQKYTSIYKSFILKYNIDMTQYVPSNYTDYRTVNEWFIRSLAPGVRPITAPLDMSVVTQPCDARLMVFQTVPEDSFIWIKDRGYTVEGLVGDAAYSRNPNFAGGAMALVRLAPQDYHQFHSPVNGTLLSLYTIEGTFHSVNADGMTSGNYAIYNQRTVAVIDTTGFANIGQVAYVAIGALCVGSITFTPPINSVVYKGQSIGYFQFGGSTIAMIFEKNRITFDQDIIDHSRRKVETLVQMGTRLGTAH